MAVCGCAWLREHIYVSVLCVYARGPVCVSTCICGCMYVRLQARAYVYAGIEECVFVSIRRFVYVLRKCVHVHGVRVCMSARA